jgi:beta-glucosidase
MESIIRHIGICLLPASFMVVISCQQSHIKNDSAAIDEKVDSVLSLMTVEEKIGQMTAFTSGWTITGPVLNEAYEEDIRSGKCGNLFNAHTVEYNMKLQRMAVEETRLGIPLLFGYDVIHGYKTIFPIPLAEACSWDPALVRKTARLSASEAAASGLNWTFNPMVDIARDPRWGRVAEGSGEDAYLGSLMAAAKVVGYQGNDLSDPYTLAACVKHYAAYGAPQAGRDYHTVDMSEILLREAYLPPYKAAIDAGAATVMTSFNELFGVPATGSEFLLKQVLRDEWNFKGMVVTDYTSMNEMVPHGYAKDLKHAGELALTAGVDMDLQGAVYRDHLMESLQEGKITMQMIDKAAGRVLKLKFKLGLFDDPYRYLDVEQEREMVLSQELLDHGLESAKRSIVLLKNEPFKGRKLLPLDENIKRIAVIGPLGNNKVDVMGTWHASGVSDDVVTVVEGLRNRYPGAVISFAGGCGFEGEDLQGFKEAIATARNSDVVILALGESYTQSGEAASRSELGLPGPQLALAQAIHGTGKPLVALIMAGRPLTINWVAEHIPAVLNAWHLGTRTGDAVASVLSGDYNPSAKLVVTFPRNVGQIPIHYNMKNTGRPMSQEKYTSKYLDVPNDPLYPFGYGLSYTTFRYAGLELSDSSLEFDETLDISVRVKNTGEYPGEEIVQLYIRDMVGSVTRPVKELKGFQKISLEPGEEMAVTFTLRSDDLRFFNSQMQYAAEPGEFRVFIGSSSADGLASGFTLLPRN